MSKMGLLYFWFVYQSPGKHLFASSTPTLQRNQRLSIHSSGRFCTRWLCGCVVTVLARVVSLPFSFTG